MMATTIYGRSTRWAGICCGRTWCQSNLSQCSLNQCSPSHCRPRQCRPRRKARWLAALLAGCLALAPLPVAALTVFDPSNFEQNLLQASRALTQITNQLHSLQNEMAMLHNMARNLAPLDYSALHALSAALQQMNDLMQRARGIGFDLAATEAAWARHYPRQYAEDTRYAVLLEDARQRWGDALDGLHQAMLVQAETVGNLAGDSEQLAALVARSDAALGNLQVGQAGNQLIALLTKQQLQAQSLAAAQYRAQTLQQARAALAQEQARLQLQQFLGSRHAYDGGR